MVAPVSFVKSGPRRCNGSATCGPTKVSKLTVTPLNFIPVASVAGASVAACVAGASVAVGASVAAGACVAACVAAGGWVAAGAPQAVISTLRITITLYALISMCWLFMSSPSSIGKEIKFVFTEIVYNYGKRYSDQFIGYFLSSREMITCWQRDLLWDKE